MTRSIGMYRRLAAGLIACLLMQALAAEASAQAPNLAHREAGEHLFLENTAPWYHQPPPLRQVRLNDLVTVVVKESASTTIEGNVDRRKNGLYDAVIKDWVNFQGLSLKKTPQHDGDPKAGGTINQTYRSDAEIELRNQMQFRITCRVVDIRPNGHLVLEANKRLREVNEVFEMSLTGIIRPEDVQPDNTVLSERIDQLSIYKRQRGHVRDSIRRGWATKIIDAVNPF